MIVPVARVEHKHLLSKEPSAEGNLATAKKSILAAREKQNMRYQNSVTNATLSNKDILNSIAISNEAKNLLTQASEKLKLTARAYFKIIKVAQSIADIEQSDSITSAHIAEALQFRQQ